MALALATVLAGGAWAVYAVWNAGPPVTRLQDMPGVLATSVDDSNGTQTAIVSRRATIPQITAVYRSLVRVQQDQPDVVVQLDVGPVRCDIPSDSEPAAAGRVVQRVHTLAGAQVPRAAEIFPGGDGDPVSVTVRRTRDAIPAARAVLGAMGPAFSGVDGLSVRTVGHHHWFDTPPGRGSVHVDHGMAWSKARAVLTQLEPLRPRHPSIQLTRLGDQVRITLHVEHLAQATTAAREAHAAAGHDADVSVAVDGGPYIADGDTAAATALATAVTSVHGHVAFIGPGRSPVEVSAPLSQIDDVATELVEHHVHTVRGVWGDGSAGRVLDIPAKSLERAASGIQRLYTLGFTVRWSRSPWAKRSPTVITLDTRSGVSGTGDPLADHPQKATQVIDAVRSLKWHGTARIVLPAGGAHTPSFRSTARGRASHPHDLDDTLQRAWDDSAGGASS